jgi:hypothetical protein
VPLIIGRAGPSNPQAGTPAPVSEKAILNYVRKAAFVPEPGAIHSLVALLSPLKPPAGEIDCKAKRKRGL